MSQLSEDESSDSSDDFLVPAQKIDLNSSFFKQISNKTNLKSVSVVQSSSDDSDDDVDYSNDNVSSAELLAQVLKNFENAKTQTLVANNNQPGVSTEQAHSNFQSDDLSKEINDLLLQGESETTLSKEDNDNKSQNKNVETEVKSDYAIPEKGIQVHLPGENLLFDRQKKKQRDLQKLLQNKINQRIRTTQVFIHKVGLLTWLAHGFCLNRLSNDPELLAVTLSLMSPSNYPKDRPDLKYIEQFTKWFTGKFLLCEKHKEVVFSKDSLMQRVSEKKIYNYVELILLYVATIRGMGINCRLIISLQPPRLKPKPDELLKIADNENKSNSSEKDKKSKSSKKVTSANVSNTSMKKNNRRGKGKLVSNEKSVTPTKVVPENSRDGEKLASLQAKSRAAAILKKNKIEKEEKNDSTEANNSNYSDDQNNLSIAEKISLNVFKRNETKKKLPPNSNNKKCDNACSSNTKLSSKGENKFSKEDSDFSDDSSEFSTDEDYVEKKPKKKTPSTKKPLQKSESTSSKATSKKYNQRKLLSSDDDDIGAINTYNVWVEVYLESEESWISVDVVDKKIHCTTELYKKAGDPVLYIIGWNSIGTLKDVTRRYCPYWLTDTRKKRVDEKWWADTLSCWKEKKTAMSKAEDEQLLQRELEQPLPKTVGECKGHPLYVLIRHLLKFEALHPPDAVPLGYLKTGEAIYSRHCVHTLYSRETWIKKARVVKPGEQAYKIVKSMPKYDKLSGQKIKDQPLEIFGKWQTMPYEPPEAQDGKVPRNEYGNVDLFKMCMLPKGTVYINLPGLNRVARKLNIDCAQACTGFNFGCRGALPAFEGYVVCEEYEDTLREAWEEEQFEAHKRATEKREKRIYGNWRKLIKGLLIREKLAAKYNFKNEGETANNEDKKPSKSTKKNTVLAKKSVQMAVENEKVSDNNTEIQSLKNKSTATKRKMISNDEDDEKEGCRNEKVETIKKQFARKVTKKNVKQSSNDNTNDKATGSAIQSNEPNFENSDGIRITRKRAAASKNLVDVNVNEDYEDEGDKKMRDISKQKISAKKVETTAKISKRSKMESDNSRKKIDR